MRGQMKIQLICNGELVNKHSDGGKHYGYNNPIEIIPPVGSVIDYLTFNQGSKENEGVRTNYRVKGYTFTTEEDYNHQYRNKVCKIEVEIVE